MTDELLPCPFCGGQAEIHATHDVDTGEIDGWFAWCNNSTCECKPETNDYCTEAEAIAAWNSRADYHGYEQAAIEAWENIKAWNSRAERTCRNVDDEFPFFKCSECECNAVVGYGGSGDGLPNYCPNCGAKVVER